MNIFYLDKDVELCARYHNDRHVVKMILESCQLLCTAHHLLDKNPDPNLYKKTHQNHPSAVWVRESVYNYLWLWELTLALNEEFKRRYNKKRDHLSIVKLRNILCFSPDRISHKPFTDPPQCMPPEYKGDDTVEAYRKYYIFDKQHLATWSNTETPYWYKNENI